MDELFANSRDDTHKHLVLAIGNTCEDPASQIV